MSFYFAYGSNMIVADMRVRCPGARVAGVARLDDYAFYVGTGGWASVQPQRGQAVHGVLWQVMSSDIAALDAYEALDEGLYDKCMVAVQSGDAPVEAMTYILRRQDTGRATAAYLDPIVAAARDFGFPSDYLRALEGWGT